MNVLYVINGLGTGGAERSLAEMLPRLRQRGVNSRIVCLYAKPEGVHGDVAKSDVEIDFLNAKSLLGRVRELRGLFKRQRPDLIHTTIIEADIVSRIAAARTGIPVLTSLVNTSYSDARLVDPNVRAWKLKLIQRIDGWTARRLTSRFHAITEAVKAAAIKDLGIDAEKITVIPRGRERSRLGQSSLERRQQVRANLGIGDQTRVLINVGRQEYQKGQEFLLSAFEQLLDQHDDILLLIAGRKGSASAALDQRLADSRKLSTRVRMLGHRNDVPDLLAASDIFVFPSLYEGLGGALIEAMALGLPIVASDVPAVREVVVDQENALLVPPTDAGQLGQAIHQLLEAPELRKQFRQRSETIFEDRFTLDHVVEEVAKLYESMAVPKVANCAVSH